MEIVQHFATFEGKSANTRPEFVPNWMKFGKCWQNTSQFGGRLDDQFSWNIWIWGGEEMRYSWKDLIQTIFENKMKIYLHKSASIHRERALQNSGLMFSHPPYFDEQHYLIYQNPSFAAWNGFGENCMVRWLRSSGRKVLISAMCRDISRSCCRSLPDSSLHGATWGPSS